MMALKFMARIGSKKEKYKGSGSAEVCLGVMGLGSGSANVCWL